MQVFTSLQTDNHASTPPLNFLQAGCLSCRPTNSIKALKAKALLLDASALLIYIAAVPLCCTELQSNADITQISTVVVLLIAVSQALIFGDF